MPENKGASYEVLSPFMQRLTLARPCPKKQALKVGHTIKGKPIVAQCIDFLNPELVVGYLLQTGYMGTIPKTR